MHEIDNHDFEGLEHHGKKGNRTLVSASVSAVTTVSLLVLKFTLADLRGLLTRPQESWEAFASKLVVTLLLGIPVFFGLQMVFFAFRCKSLFTFIVHYVSIFLKDFFVFTIFFAVSVAGTGLLLFAASRSFRQPFPSLFLVMATPFVALVLAFARQAFFSLAAKKGRVEYFILDEHYGRAPAKQRVGALVNKEIVQALLAVRDADLICLAGIHLSFLMQHECCLRAIREQNPRAAIFFMPQFPYTLRMYERAVALDYDHHKGYVMPLITSAHNARELLNAEVRLRHREPYWRLVLSAKLSEDTSSLLHTELLRPTPLRHENITIDSIVSGQGGIQRYIRGHEGAEGSYRIIDTKAWGQAHAIMLRWFFKEWHGATTPIDLSSLKADTGAARKVLQDYRWLYPRMRLLWATRNPTRALDRERPLIRFYDALHSGKPDDL